MIESHPDKQSQGSCQNKELGSRRRLYRRTPGPDGSLLTARQCSWRKLAGFTLIEMSIVIAIIGTVVVAIVSMGSSMIESARKVNTQQKLDTIETALMAFRLANERLPCPGDATLTDIPPNAATYGYEAANLGSCIAGSPAANWTASNSNSSNIPQTTTVAEGAVPVKSLNLPDEYQWDGWGRKFSYAVWTPLTGINAFLIYGLQPMCGGITVENAGHGYRSTAAAYALVSYGPDGHGGYTKTGSRYFAGSDNADEWTNCHCNASADAGNYSATYVQEDRTQTSATDSLSVFDDIVRFKERWQMQDAYDTYVTGGNSCGQPGFVIAGNTANSRTLSSVVFGDINGDGIPDMIILAAGSQWDTAPAVYVIFGQSNASFSNPYLVPPTLNGSNGFTITGFSSGNANMSVAIGDVNNDSKPDLVIYVAGAYNGPSAVYVIFGQSSTYSWPASLNVNTIDGSNGGVISFPYNEDNYGNVALGDINGDGVKDIVVGASESINTNPQNSVYQAGSVYVVFGHSGAWSSYGSPMFYSSINGMNGFTIIGTATGQMLGSAVAAGDINGDSIDDLVFYDIDSGGHVNNWYVLFGKKLGTPWGSPWSNPFDPTTLNGTNGFVISQNSYSDGCLSAAFVDLNGDNIKDLALGGCYSSNAGEVDVIWGKSGGSWPASIAMSAPPAGCCTIINGVTVGDYTGSTLASAGDFNHDGIQDLLIGAWGTNPNGLTTAGSGFVVYGSTSAWPASFNLSSLNGSNGVRFDGGVAGAGIGWLGAFSGDVNNDGRVDLIIANPSATYGGNAQAGFGYVIYGSGGSWASPYNLGTLR